MIKLLKGDIIRLFKSKIFWICFFLLTTWGGIQRIGIKMDIEACYLDETFWIDALLIGIVLSVFISLFVGAEFEEDTIRNKILICNARSDVYLSNVTVCIIAGWLMCLGCLISSLLVGIPLLGFFHEKFSIILLQGICVFALSAAYTAIYCFIAMLNSNRAIISIICMLLSVLLLLAGAAVSNQLEQEGGTERRIYEMIFEILPGGQSLQLSGMIDENVRYIEMFLASLGWIIISSCCGIAFFQKRDLK